MNTTTTSECINLNTWPRSELFRFYIDEMRIVMLKVWHELQLKNPILFDPSKTGPFCQREHCQEGKMSCRHPISKNFTPAIILAKDYPLLLVVSSNL